MLNYLDHPDPPSGLVTPLVDGMRYFADFFDVIDTMGAGDRLYIMNWHIAPNFDQKADLGDEPAESTMLAHKLVDLVAEGVDVRVLVWLNTNYFRPDYDVLTLADQLLGERRADKTIAQLRWRLGDDDWRL